MKSKVKIAELLKLEKPLVLASASPRRKKLLTELGFDFRVVPSDIDEDNHNHLSPEARVQELALEKARAVGLNLIEDSIVLGADTIVVLGGQTLNKPTDEKDAINILKLLSNKTHIVFSGIALLDSASGMYLTAYQATSVTFRQLDENEIHAYVLSGSPMDKAGAYGIQDDFGAVFVSRVEGCYYNIVGLPLELLYRKLGEFQKSLEN